MIFTLSAQDRPIRALILSLIAWKSLLLIVAACSPGNAYDTSTSLTQHNDHILDTDRITLLLSFISQKLTRWDAIYFTAAARRGYLYEQEWAFGWGSYINMFATCLNSTHLGRYTFLQGLVGIIIAHVCHGLSVLALYSLTRSILPTYDHANKVAFLTACLHILAPAGIFLSAPYGESTFAFLNIAGVSVFYHAFGDDAKSTVLQDLSIMLSGVLLGIATSVRSNGLLGGFLFLEEAIKIAWSLRNGIRLSVCRRLVAVGIGGVCVALGFMFPQYLAYREYCAGVPDVDKRQRPSWCQNTIPSIYTHVQSHYWNVGFLRYWTWSNIPLFVLATPMLGIMIISACAVIGTCPSTGNAGITSDVDSNHTPTKKSNRSRNLLRNLAIQQSLLAILALFSYHVQIITRISSAYPVWQIWLASSIIYSCASHGGDSSRKTLPGYTTRWRALIKYMLVYGVVQAGLFASFLPPA